MSRAHRLSPSPHHLSGHTGNQYIPRCRRKKPYTSPPGYCLISHRHCLPSAFRQYPPRYSVLFSHSNIRKPEQFPDSGRNRQPPFFPLPSSLPVLLPQTPRLPSRQSSAVPGLPPGSLSLSLRSSFPPLPIHALLWPSRQTGGLQPPQPLSLPE